MFKIVPFSPKLLSCPVFVHLAQFSYIEKQHFSVKTLDANWCVSHPAACLSCFLFDLWINIGLATNVWCTKQMVIRGWMFNQSCSVEFFSPSLLGGFSYAQSTVSYVIYCLDREVDRLPFCVLQLLRKGLYEIRSFPSVSAYAFRLAHVLRPFPLTVAFLSYFCKCLLEWQRSEKKSVKPVN